MACCRRCCCRRTNRTEVRVFNQNNFIPSAVQVNYSLTQPFNVGSELEFNETTYNTGVSFSPRQDGFGVDIVSAGVYKITFTGTATASQNLTASIAISLNGVAMPQSEVSQLITTEGPEILYTTIVFKVISPSANIDVINTGSTNFSVTNAKLDIVRVGNF